MAHKYKGVVSEYRATEDETTRYLIRTAGDNPLICLGLNPSKANKINSDQTICRVEEYAKRNNYDSIAMLNLYPLRSTNPDNLPLEKNESIYIKNIEGIKNFLKSLMNRDILVATGGDVRKRLYLHEALKELISFGNDCGVKWLCIGLTADKYPRHPSRGVYREFELFNPESLL